MSRCAILGLLIITAIVPLACDRGEEEGQAMQVAVIPKGTAHEYWKSVHAGAIKAARELTADGRPTEIIWQGPANESQRDVQIDLINTMSNRGVAGIVLAPLDNEALVRPVAEAARKDIPVVIIDSGLNSEDSVSFVATDNRKGGKLGGEYLAEQLGGEGKVIMLRYMQNSASTNNREQGFLDAMSEAEGIEVLSSDQYGGDTIAKAQDKANTLLKKFTDENSELTINGIFCPNQSTTLGMLQALRRQGLAGKVKFVGFDADERLLGALREEHIGALVVQNPLHMGYTGVMTLADHIAGKEVPERVDTGVQLVTPENVDDPEIQKVVAPDLSKWLD